MQKAAMTVEQLISAINQLPPRERLQVIARVLPGLERELPDGRKPKRSLWGLCADLGAAPSAAEIEELRKEMHEGFLLEEIGNCRNSSRLMN